MIFIITKYLYFEIRSTQGYVLFHHEIELNEVIILLLMRCRYIQKVLDVTKQAFIMLCS